jgi:hypothetical protein
MALSPEMIAANRSAVSDSFRAAHSENRRRYLRGDATAGPEYIYDNQMNDASNVAHMFYDDDYRVVSIIKKTKVGANGFMIALAYLMTTHPDDDFVVNPENVRFITGMSNKKWEDDMKHDAPVIFADKIFHHGALKDANLNGLRDALIFVDEVDTGSNENMVLQMSLRAAGLLKIHHMKHNNIRFVFISATMTRELNHLYRWGTYHEMYRMTIPPSYIGHDDFIRMGITHEFYPVNSVESACQWVKEDIVDNYGSDCRVGIIRATARNREFIRYACMTYGVEFRDHTSSDRIDDNEFKEIFEKPRTKHMVIAVKGLLRRANLIPNRWKLMIGPVHECHSAKPDANVQTQGLLGRMTGHWRESLVKGHKTGPYRTSIEAIEQSVSAYDDPFGKSSFESRDFKKKPGGKVQKNTPSFASVSNIEGLNGVDAPLYNDTDTVPKEIILTPDEHAYLCGHEVETSWDNYRSEILKMIEAHSPGYLKTLPHTESPKILAPVVTRNKIISKLATANKNGIQYNWNDGQIKRDTFKIYIDTEKPRLFVSVCYGSKRTTRPVDEVQTANIPVA